MFANGSMGGATHSLHNNIKGNNMFDNRRFGKFTTIHYTLVNRPNF